MGFVIAILCVAVFALFVWSRVHHTSIRKSVSELESQVVASVKSRFPTKKV